VAEFETCAGQHAVLTCKWITGSHTYDVLADAMTSTHSKFGLQDKVRRTTTDNGSNFVKAFVQFGSIAEALPALTVVPEDEVDPVDGEQPDEPTLEQFEEEPETEAFVPVDEALDHAVHVAILPKHMRCAAHTLNLVATTDAKNALQDELFESASTSAMKKAWQLWKTQSRSTTGADIIKEELNKRLVIPNSTWWNSLYDSVKVLNELAEDPISK
jgi:hypothetical protein